MMVEWILGGLLTLLQTALLLGLAGLAFARLRGTMSGLLLTGAFAVWAIKSVVFFLSGAIMPQLFADPLLFLTVQNVSSALLWALIQLGIGVGVAMLPSSLAKLRGG